MSAAEEALAILQASQLFGNPNLRLDRMRASDQVSAEAKELLDDLQGADPVIFSLSDFSPPYSLSLVAASLDNYLAQRDEEEIQIEAPSDKTSPIRVCLKTRSLLLIPILLAVSFALSGCTTRPRVTSGGDTHYTSTTTITVSALEGAGSLPPVVGQAMRLARNEQKEMRWPEQD